MDLMYDILTINFMKLNTIILGVSVIITLLLGTLHLSNKVKELKEENRLWQQNLYNSVNESNQILFLQTENQFKQMYPYIDSVVSNMEVNNITNVTHITHHYKGDTTIIELVQEDINKPIFNFEKDTMCYKIGGTINTEELSLSLNKIEFTDEITIVIDKERERLFGWKWTPRWSRKFIYDSKVNSKCGSNIESISIHFP